MKYWVLILMMPFLSAVIINLVFSANENDKSMMSSYMICIGGLLYLNLSVFNYFESYDKQIRLAALEKISEKENENYQAIAGSYEEIRNIKHDLKNQVSLLNDLIKKEDYITAQNYNLNNLGEYQNKTEPYNPDTDEDGFLDGDEINKYKTDPLNPDTDNDGLLDGEESYDGSIYAKYGVYFDPLNPDTNGNGILDGDEVFGQSKQQEVETHDEAITEIKVDMDTNGNLDRNLTIESMYSVDAMSTNVYSLIGEPFNFETPTSFKSATITFKVDKSKLGDTKFDNLLILWYDEENQIFKEMETIHDEANSTVSTTTTHFSQYMIVDSEKWFERWEDSFEKLREMWSGNTSYYKALNTILIVDCSWKMASVDPIDYRSIEIGYNGVTKDNYYDIVSDMDSPWDVEQAYLKYGRRKCSRASICENIINNMSSGDRIALIMHGSGIQSNTGLTGSYYPLMSAVQNVNNDGSSMYLNNAVSTALSYVSDDVENMYRIVVLTTGDVSFGYDLSSYDYTNVSLNVVSLSGSFNSYLESIAYDTEGDVYYGYPSSSLTGASGGSVTIPPQFIGEDSDGDGIPDLVELYGLKPNGEPINSDPYSKHSDEDGLEDNEELHFSRAKMTYELDKSQYDGSVFVWSDPCLDDTDGDEFPDNYNKAIMSTENYYPCNDPNPLKSDVTEIALKNDFFSVNYEYKGSEENKDNDDYNWKLKNNNNNASYGGYQGWLGRYGYTQNDKIFCLLNNTGGDIHNSGCGIIAVADMFLYMALTDDKYNPKYMPDYTTPICLGDNYNNIDFDTYVEYVTEMSNLFHIYGWPINGIPAVMPLDISSLLKSMDTINSCNDMGLSISWEHNTNKNQFSEKMKEMLNDDIPAAFSYCDSDELQLYRFINKKYTTKNSTTVTSHYMVATGMIEYSDEAAELIGGHKCMVRIATYGKEYYMDLKDYNPSFLDTNIIYVRK